jgi:hypothetical protein
MLLWWHTSHPGFVSQSVSQVSMTIDSQGHIEKRSLSGDAKMSAPQDTLAAQQVVSHPRLHDVESILPFTYARTHARTHALTIARGCSNESCSEMCSFQSYIGWRCHTRIGAAQSFACKPNHVVLLPPLSLRWQPLPYQFCRCGRHRRMGAVCVQAEAATDGVSVWCVAFERGECLRW